MRQSGTGLVATLYAYLVMALPVMLVPFSVIAPDLQKGMITMFLLGIVLCVGALSIALFRRDVEVPRSVAAYSGFGLVAVAFVSSLVAGIDPHFFTGNAFDLGTVGSLLLFALAVLSGSLVSSRMVERLIAVFAFVVAAAAGVSVGIAALNPELLGGKTLAGEWSDLTSLIAAALIVCSTYIDTAADARWRLIYSGCGVVLLACFALFFELTTATLLLFVLMVGGILATMSLRTGAQSRFVPLASIFLALAVSMMLVFGMKSPLLNVSPAPARPSFLATELLVASEYADSVPTALFGMGPNSFPVAWEHYRMIETNYSIFADVTPATGDSTAMTIAVELGALGILAFLSIPLLLIGIYVMRIVRNSGESHTAMSVCAMPLALFSFAVAFMQPASLPLFLVAGAAAGFVIRCSLGAPPIAHFASRRFGSMLVAMLFLAGGLFSMTVSVRQFIAADQHARGISTTSLEAKAATLAFAADMWGSAEHDRDASRAYVQRAMRDASAGRAQDMINESIQRSIAYAEWGTTVEPREYGAWLYRASLYVALQRAKYPDAETLARQSLRRATLLAPLRPDVPYVEGQLELALGNTAAAYAAFSKSLSLKSDYAPAIELLGAITSVTKAATSTMP